MTIKDFQDKHCQLCGTQSCLAEAEDIQNCGRYNGEIEGLPKIKSFMERWEEYMKEKNITWNDIREMVKDG